MVEYKKNCKICNKEFIAKSKKALYCSTKCLSKSQQLKKEQKIRSCKHCGKIFIVNKYNKKYCSNECLKAEINKNCRELHILQRNELFNNNSIEGYDYVICPICKQKFKQITNIHFSIHGINTIEEIYKKFPNIQLTCNKLIETNLLGNNNPMSKENTTDLKRKQSSAYSLEYYKKRGAKNDDEAINMRQIFLDKLKPLRKNWKKSNLLSYYLEKGYTEEEAIRIRKEKCKSNGLDWYIQKYGEKEGTEKFNKRINYWKYKLYNGKQRSKIADEFFNELIKLYDTNNEIYYGDNEYIISNNEHVYKLDFLDKTKNKIIEFYGDFWHMNPIKYKDNAYNKTKHLYAYEIWKYDKNREDALINMGYKILIIWEYEYKNNKLYFINKALNFLNK